MGRKMQLKCSPSACSKSEQHKARAGISHSSSYSWVAASTDALGSRILLCGETRVGFEVVENQPYHSHDIYLFILINTYRYLFKEPEQQPCFA